jgi:signal transduction histidine kinase
MLFIAGISLLVGIVIGAIATALFKQKKSDVKTITEAALKQKSLQKRLNNMPAGIVEFSNDGTLLLANRFAMDVLEIKVDPETGKEVLDIDSLNPLNEAGKPTKTNQTPFMKAVRKRRPIHNAIMGIQTGLSQNTTWLQVDAEPIFDESGKATSVMICFLDITSRRQQDSMIQSQQAELVQTSRMSSLGVMASGVAHEINNPLAIIKGRIDIFLRKIEKTDPNHEMLRGLRGMNQNIKRITKIVASLQQYAGVSISQSIEPVLANDIVEGAVQFCQEKFKNKEISLIIEKGPDDLQVECQLVDIVQVLFNLLSNAYDAVSEINDENVDKWIKIQTYMSGKNVQFKVSDSGIGIKNSHVDKILLPFFTTKNPGAGTGLGLSISQRLVDNHGGRLELDLSSPHTCFVIEIPQQHVDSYSSTGSSKPTAA